jgi:hypothetical protein
MTISTIRGRSRLEKLGAASTLGTCHLAGGFDKGVFQGHGLLGPQSKTGIVPVKLDALVSVNGYLQGLKQLMVFAAHKDPLTTQGGVFDSLQRSGYRQGIAGTSLVDRLGKDLNDIVNSLVGEIVIRVFCFEGAMVVP